MVKPCHAITKHEPTPPRPFSRAFHLISLVPAGLVATAAPASGMDRGCGKAQPQRSAPLDAPISTTTPALPFVIRHSSFNLRKCPY